VAEIDLNGPTRHSLDSVIARARAIGADKLWIHARVVDARFGLEPCRGYARLEAAKPPTPIRLPNPPRFRIHELQCGCFSDVWGHHDPGPPAPDSIFVGLHERGQWVGICEVDPEAQWIDGPGLLPGFRTPERYARLVRGAARYLKADPVVLETWGDAAQTLAAYLLLGFRLVESVPGWELDLRVR
jgi:hypothetical protein